MIAKDPLLFRQLQLIRKIIQDETWLEAERRGRPVSPDDRAVRENVCRVVLRIGQQMREAARAALTREAGAPTAMVDLEDECAPVTEEHPAAA